MKLTIFHSTLYPPSEAPFARFARQIGETTAAGWGGWPIKNHGKRHPASSSLVDLNSSITTGTPGANMKDAKVGYKRSGLAFSVLLSRRAKFSMLQCTLVECHHDSRQSGLLRHRPEVMPKDQYQKTQAREVGGPGDARRRWGRGQPGDPESCTVVTGGLCHGGSEKVSGVLVA